MAKVLPPDRVTVELHRNELDLIVRALKLVPTFGDDADYDASKGLAADLDPDE
jgi:hypothetical protein